MRIPASLLLFFVHSCSASFGGYGGDHHNRASSFTDYSENPRSPHAPETYRQHHGVPYGYQPRGQQAMNPHMHSATHFGAYRHSYLHPQQQNHYHHQEGMVTIQSQTVTFPASAVSPRTLSDLIRGGVAAPFTHSRILQRIRVVESSDDEEEQQPRPKKHRMLDRVPIAANQDVDSDEEPLSHTDGNPVPSVRGQSPMSIRSSSAEASVGKTTAYQSDFGRLREVSTPQKMDGTTNTKATETSEDLDGSKMDKQYCVNPSSRMESELFFFQAPRTDGAETFKAASLEEIDPLSPQNQPDVQGIPLFFHDALPEVEVVHSDSESSETSVADEPSRNERRASIIDTGILVRRPGKKIHEPHFSDSESEEPSAIGAAATESEAADSETQKSPPNDEQKEAAEQVVQSQRPAKRAALKPKAPPKASKTKNNNKEKAESTVSAIPEVALQPVAVPKRGAKSAPKPSAEEDEEDKPRRILRSQVKKSQVGI